MDEKEDRYFAVLKSEGPFDGRRISLSGQPGSTLVMVENTGQQFAWDGTFDEHGDARYVEQAQTTNRSPSSAS